MFEELGGHDKGNGPQERPNCRSCRKLVEHILFQFASYDSQGLDFLYYLKMVHPPGAFKIFFRGSIFHKTAIRLGEKEGMLVNDECSSWYNTVGNYF